MSSRPSAFHRVVMMVGVLTLTLLLGRGGVDDRVHCSPMSQSFIRPRGVCQTKCPPKSEFGELVSTEAASRFSSGGASIIAATRSACRRAENSCTRLVVPTRRGEKASIRKAAANYKTPSSAAAPYHIARRPTPPPRFPVPLQSPNPHPSPKTSTTVRKGVFLLQT